MFEQDWRERQSEIEATIRGRRLLVIGGAGSIGSATVKLVADFKPQALHVVDPNENNLAELVRDLRSREQGLDVNDFRTLPIDFGSPIMRRFVASEAPYDLILNFAAIKHVRSEKDTCSLLQMLDTNVIKPARFLRRDRFEGTIAAGKAADLVLLDANPLQDIRNTRALRGVVIHGRFLDRSELDRLLARTPR